MLYNELYCLTVVLLPLIFFSHYHYILNPTKKSKNEKNRLGDNALGITVLNKLKIQLSRYKNSYFFDYEFNFL